MSPLDSY